MDEEEKKFKRGMVVEITEDYDVFENNVKGMRGTVLRPYSVDRLEGDKHNSVRVVKHLIYVEEIDMYCEPREEWLTIIDESG
jgi:hypothetical protein